MKEITSYEQFKEVIKSETPVVIKFGAPWCGPCRSIEPNLEQASADGLDVYKLNVDNIPEAAIDFGVMGVPVTFAFESGRARARESGVLTTEQIKALAQQ